MKQLIIAALAYLSCACSPALQAIPQDGPQSATELRSALRPPQVQSVQGQARLNAFLNGDRRSVGLLLLIQRPAQAQFQALSPSLDMLALLSTNGQRFVSFERGARECLTGKACPRNLSRFLPLPLSAPELVALLLGDPPLLDPPADQQRLAWDAERGLYRLELGPTDAWHQHVYVAPKTLRPVGVIWFEGAQRTASVEYQGEVGAGGLPRLLRVKVTKPEADVSVELRDVVADQPIDDSVFEVGCPSGATEVELPCGGK